MMRPAILLAFVVACTPAATPHSKVPALSFQEHRVMDDVKGLPTDTAASIDAYNARWKTIEQRPDAAGPRPADDFGAIFARFGRRVEPSLVRYAVANERGDDFAAIVIDGNSADEYLVRKASRSTWETGGSMNHGACDPIFVGNDLVSVTLEHGTNVVVRRENAVVHRIVLPEERQRFKPEQLTSWNGHWVLEFDGDVIVDGESLKKKNGYAEVFDWMLVGGDPLFFFVKNGRTGVSHRGEELAVSYDHVLHGGCCEPAAYNPQQTSWGVRFHARRGVTWYYVEAAVSS